MEEQEGISAIEINNFTEHLKDIPTRILKSVLADILYEFEERGITEL